MPIGDVIKTLVGGGLILLGALTGVPIVSSLGATLALGGIAGIVGSLGGGDATQQVNLAARQQGTLLSNHPTPGAPVPVVYGRAKVGSIIADYRIDTAAKEDILVPCVLSHGSRDGLGIAGIDEIYFDDRLAFDASTPPVVQAPFTSGTAAATELRGLDAENWGITTAGGKSLSGVTSDWSAATDKGGGLAGMLLLLSFDTDIYPTGLPVFTAKLSGNFVEDTRSKVSGVNITFANGGGSATITRASGSFVTDGWIAADRVDVSGSASNDGKYTIATVAATVLTLVVAQTLTAEGPVAGVTLKRWAHPTSGGGDNPALCIRDYLLSPVYGAAMAETDIDDTSFEAMANYYDETVTIPSGSQKRYRCNGWIDVSRSIAQVLGELLSCCRGNLVYEGGKFRLFTTRSVTPSAIALTQDNIVGDWQFTNAGAKQKYNVARATFIDPTRNHMPDLVQWPNPGATNTFLTDDNSFENRLSVDLPFTFDRFQAEQTVMTMVKESRQGIAAAVTCTEEALQFQIGDVAPVTHDTPGWTAKNFWIMGIGILSDKRVRLALVEYDAVAYSLDAETADAGEPNTDLPNPFTVAAPTGFALAATSAEALVPGDGEYITRIKLSWTAPVETFIDHYDVQAKHTVDANYDTREPVIGSAVESFITAADSISWDVRIRTVNTLGVVSSWVSASVTPDKPAGDRITGSEQFILNGDFEDGFAFWQGDGGFFSLETVESDVFTGTKSLKVVATGINEPANRRRSLLGLMPIPDGSFANALDRRQLLDLYRGSSLTPGGGPAVMFYVNDPRNDVTKGSPFAIRVDPDDVFRIRAAGKRNAGAGDVRIIVRRLDGSKAIIDTLDSIIFTETGYKQKDGLVTMTLDTRFVNIGIRVDNDTTAFLDAIEVYRQKTDVDVKNVGADKIGNDGSDTTLGEDISQTDGVGVGTILKRPVTGVAKHADAITFPVAFQNAPFLLFPQRRGILHEPRTAKWSNGLNTTIPQYDLLRPLNLSASGFTVDAQLWQKASQTAQTDNFVALNNLTALGQTVEADLNPSIAVADNYTVHFSVKLRIITPPDPFSFISTGSITVAIDSNDGAGWVERAVRTYSGGADSEDSVPFVEFTFSHEEVTISVSGLGLNDDLRLRIKAVTGKVFGFDVHGFDGTGDPSDGVTYSTTAGDSFANKTPDTEDEIDYLAVAHA